MVCNSCGVCVHRDCYEAPLSTSIAFSATKLSHWSLNYAFFLSLCFLRLRMRMRSQYDVA